MSERTRRKPSSSTPSKGRATTPSPASTRGAGGPVVPGLQRKAVVGTPGDRWEREADTASDRIKRGESVGPVSPVSASALQRSTEELAQTAVDEEPAQMQGEDDEVQASSDDELAQTAVDEEPVQQTADDEEGSIGLNEEEPVQAEPVIGVSEEQLEEGGGVHAKLDEEPAQAKGGSGSGVEVPRGGAGAPIPPATRAPIEQGLGADLSAVRVHDDSTSRKSADGLGAKAYTHGSDIYLGSGHSSNDMGLMAHESTHVVQQAGGRGVAQHSRSGVVQRNGDGDAGGQAGGAGVATADGQPVAGRAPDNSASSFVLPGVGSIDTTTDQITLESIRLPQWKITGPPESGLRSTPVTDPIPKLGTRNTRQVSRWNTAVREGISSGMEQRLEAAPEVNEPLSRSRIYFLSYNGSNGYLIGTLNQIKARARRPDWDRNGRMHFFDVDHFQEMQIGGADTTANYWLLDAQANQTSGSRINGEVTSKVNELLNEARPWIGQRAPSSGVDARTRYAIKVRAFQPRLPGTSGDPTKYWLKSEVEAGAPLDALTVLSEEQATAANLIGDGAQNLHTLFTSSRGGSNIQFDWDSVGNVATPRPEGPQQLWPDFEHTAFTYDGTAGELVATAFGSDDNPFEPFEIRLDARKLRNLPQASYVNGRNIESKMRQSDFPGASPVEWIYAEMRDGVGLAARGILRPSLPIFEGTEIDIVVEGNDVSFEKTFTGEEFNLPGPISVTGTSLTVSAGTRGVAVIGNANFEIDRVGTGHIGATASADTEGAAFEIEGAFEFDTELFSQAEINVWYRDNTFGGSGVLAIEEGKIPGVTGARLTATIDGDQINAEGQVDVDVPGVDSGTMTLSYSPDAGLVIGGELQLSSDVPGISSGTLDATLAKSPDGPWKMSGGLSAVPSIPGISSRLTGRYDDGIVTLQATAQYARGMAAGELTVGVTNEAIDEAGVPTGEVTPEMRAFGGGSVTLTLAPWLQATAGIRLLPNGEIEVTGEIGLPSALEIFPERTLERSLFSVNLDIPILGVAAAGQRVGIFATIGGGASLRAFFGPAQLRNVSAGVTWNPDRPDETTVTGHAELHLPAGAGVRLNVSAAIGAGIPLVSAMLGLEIGGELGVEAEIGADFDLNWSPTTGLSLETVARASAQPKFVFDITGFALVELDLLLTTITLYEQRWRLAELEFGSDMRLGMTLPISYQEGAPFEPSLDDITFEVPEIDPMAMLSGLVGQVV